MFLYFFQNEDVLRYSTIPNVKLNGDFNSVEFKFYSGAWGSLGDELSCLFGSTDKFDYILTSETIYHSPSYADLHGVFTRLLKPSGVMYPCQILHFGNLFIYRLSREERTNFQECILHLKII